MTLRTVGLILAILLAPVAASAQTNVDTQFWLFTSATLRPSENWRIWLEEQPRWFENVSSPFQILTRVAVGRRLHPRATLWGGYAWVAKPPGPGVTSEQRAWEQLSATFPEVATVTPSLRLRLEQRWQGNWSDSSHRFRMMGRAVKPITADRRWSIAAWDELFVTLDDTTIGPAQGIDQNRLFGGILRQFNPKVGLEFGYLWHTTEPPGGVRSHANVAFVWLNLTP